MNLSFTNPFLLFLLPVIGIPLLIHLFARSKPPVYHFPNIDFIRKARRNTMRIRRPQDRLLLMLRTALVAALLFLFLRPVIHLPGTQSSTSGRGICLLIDATASMGVTENGQTRLARACAEASETIRKLKRRDVVNLVWMRTEPKAVFPTLGKNLDRIRSALRSAQPTQEACDPAQALDLAVRMLDTQTEQAKAIYLISDFQQTQWSDFTWQCPDDVELIAIPVAEQSIPNTAITDLISTPSRPLPGQPLILTATLVNDSALPVQQTLYWSYGAQRKAQAVSLPANSEVPVILEIPAPTTTNEIAECRIDDDRFPADNTRSIVLQPVQSLRIGLYNPSSETAQIWARVINALQWADIIMSSNLEHLADCDLLLLADWDGYDGEPAVRQAIQQSKPIIWAPVLADAPPPILTQFGILPDAFSAKRRLDPPQKMIVNCEDCPLFDIFQHGVYGDPVRARFNHRIELAANPDNADILLAYEDATPALIRHHRQPLYIWNIPLSSQVTDWASHEEFFVLFAELLQQDFLNTGPARAIHLPGVPLTWRPAVPLNPDDVYLKDKNDHPISTQPTANNAQYVSSAIEHPGVYTWYYRDIPMLKQAVNFPPIESDLTVMKAERILDQNSLVVESGRTVQRLREGIELWPWILALALAAAVAEGVVTWLAERKAA